VRSIRYSTVTAAVVLAIAILLQGCQTQPEVRADYDHAADFSKYRTFNFVPQPSTEKLGYSSLTTQEIKNAVSAELQKRGYQLDTENPDLLVNFSGKLREKQEIESVPGPYYGYRFGFYGPWPGYALGSDIYTVNYKEGTLNVDLIDASRMQMVWEGVAVGEVTQKQLENREASINTTVQDIFAKFPFQAGQSEPIKTAEK
jgi:hypothetical protein